MSLSSRFAKPLIAAFAVAAGASASAQDCTASLSDPACYHLKGSDTLFDIMTQGILAARAAGVQGANNLFYDGTGSGTAESAMTANTGGAPLPGVAAPLGSQSIGAMSRNFRPKFIDSGWGSFVAADGTTSTTKVGHASWAPTCYNVVALDAGVFLTRSSGAGSSCKDIDFPVFVDNSIPASAVPRASVNNAGLPTLFGDSGAFNNTGATSNYTNLMSVILSGVDGSGTLAACADPRRVQALQDLAGCMGVADIEHLYRRDDNSGTTDTFKDRIMVTAAADTRYPYVGGRFCNGTSIGNITGTTLQTGVCSVTRTNTTCKVDANCPTGEVCQFNLNNQDFDPIRRACVAADGTHAPTSCTDMTTGRTCQATDNNPNCTQGVIVALTDPDPGTDSATNAIGARVKNDASGQSMGYAGREAVLPGKGTRGLTVNKVGFSDANVRKEAYLLSRRLFLQNSVAAGQPLVDQPSDTASFNGLTGQGTNQLTAEQNFFNWITQRPNLDPIVSKYNYITCHTDPTVDPCGLSNNLCAKTPAAAVAGALGAYLPSGSFGASGAGGAKSINSQGLTWNGTTAVGDTTTAGTLCAGGKATGTTCPAYTGRPSNAACSQNSDCASGVCADGLFIGVLGVPVSLICQ
jgi:hypothetical protein